MSQTSIRNSMENKTQSENKVKGLQPKTSRVSRAFIVGVCSEGVLSSVCVRYEPHTPKQGPSPNMLILKNRCYAKRV